jgi:hypothetical protein
MAAGPAISMTPLTGSDTAAAVTAAATSGAANRLELGSGNTDPVAVGGGVCTDPVAVGGGVCNGPQELEELRRANGGVGLTGRFDELLLATLAGLGLQSC